MRTFLELAEQRQSDRAYDTRPVEKEKFERILEAARISPSACNGQPWKIIIVDDPTLKDQIADATSSKALGFNHFTKQAPIHLVIVEENTNFTSKVGGWIKRKHFPDLDLGSLASHITLTAADEGLGSCIIGWLDEKAIKRCCTYPLSKRLLFLFCWGIRPHYIVKKRVNY